MVDYLDFFNRYIMGSIQMLMGFHFFTSFLKKKVKLIYYLLFVIFTIAILAVIQDSSMTEFLAYVILLIASGIFVCKANSLPVVLYAVMTVEIPQRCYGIFNSILCILYPLMRSFDQAVIGVVFMILGNTALLVAIFFYRMVCKYFSYDETFKIQYILMILTPTLLIFIMGEYISSIIYGNTITMGSSANIGNADHYQMLMIQLLGMASLFCVMFSYKKLLENFRLSMELSLLEQEEHSLSQYVEEAKEHYEKTKSFRHDVKNHITVVKELLLNDKLEQALNYIGDIGGITEELSLPFSTNNPVVDILVGNKLGIAKSNGIDVNCSLILPYPCHVRDIDFCIILSNALDNAICACRSMDKGVEKYIHLTGSIQGDFILLEVENSFQGKGVFRKGTGLSNIKAVAEKYHGSMNVEVQDTAFFLSVLLIIPQHSESILQQIY